MVVGKRASSHFVCMVPWRKFRHQYQLVVSDSEILKLIPVSHLRSLITAPITVNPFESLLLEVVP